MASYPELLDQRIQSDCNEYNDLRNHPELPRSRKDAALPHVTAWTTSPDCNCCR